VTTFRKLLICWGIIITVSLFACRQVEEVEAPQQVHKKEFFPAKLKILTTIAPLYSFTKNVVGEVAIVNNLLPSGVGPHEYSLSPRDVRKISEAEIIIKNGVNLETWLDKIISPTKNSGNTRPIVVDTSKGIEIINNDPHIWLSPKNVIIQVKNIRDALVKIDPDNSEIYSKNAAKYLERLKTLDREIENRIKNWKRKEFVAFHSAFLYFSKHYGLKQVAVIQELPEEQPTPKHIADVINIIKNRGIKVIFTEPGASNKLVKSIARDLKLQIYSLDTLETGALYPEWYEVRMRANLQVLNMVLGQYE
jgi:zinc/manganese transport system substrate-binding protein